MTDSYPRQQARTLRFRLGAPAGFSVAPDGSRVAFVRSSSGSDPVNRLLVADICGSGVSERIVADPMELLTSDEQLPPAERARRERMREATAGITQYATDEAVSVASFALSGQVGIASLSGNSPAVLLDVAGPAIDPRVDPTGQYVAWVAGKSLHAAAIDGSRARVLAEPDGEGVTWGMADFLAAEEFDRLRGFWWSPDGTSLIAERFDETAVNEWFIADPSQPEVAPASVRYPAAGTSNPEVSLWLVSLDGKLTEIRWDRAAFGYVVSVRWSRYGPPLVTVLNREQNQSLVLVADPESGATTVLAAMSDPCWVEHLPGTPAWSPGGELITTAVSESGVTDSLAANGAPLLPHAPRVRAVLEIDDDGLLLATHDRATENRVEFLARTGQVFDLTGGGGWHSAVRGGPTSILISTDLNRLDWSRKIVHWSPVGQTPSVLGEIASFAETPIVVPRCELISAGTRGLNTVVLWPADHVMGSSRLPVIMNPYGGPHAQRVIEAGRTFAEAQWLADQGFCVIVADGRGSPGRGPAWEREIFRDLASAPLEDQIDVLTAVARLYPGDVDIDRVGIAGWSFGGYLAALAVLRRPDVFHVAVAGAPVTEWRLYDTAYTERYLGNPAVNPDPYDGTSLIPLAAGLRRPLMIIHGMADDNVVVAHSLQLSSALTAAGRPHTFLPLSNVTHMTPQEEIAENLLLLQVDFVKSNLR